MGVSEKAGQPIEQRYLTVDEVARLLRTTPYSVTRKCRDKVLRATKPFGTWLIYAEDVEELLAAKANDVSDEAETA